MRGCILQHERFWVISGVLEIFHRQMGQLPPLFLPCIWVGCRRYILDLLNSEKGLQAKPLTRHAPCLLEYQLVPLLPDPQLSIQHGTARAVQRWAAEGRGCQHAHLAHRELSLGPLPAPEGAGLQPCSWTSLALVTCICSGCLGRRAQPPFLCTCKSPMLNWCTNLAKKLQGEDIILFLLKTLSITNTLFPPLFCFCCSGCRLLDAGGCHIGAICPQIGTVWPLSCQCANGMLININNHVAVPSC